MYRMLVVALFALVAIVFGTNAQQQPQQRPQVIGERIPPPQSVADMLVLVNRHYPEETLLRLLKASPNKNWLPVSTADRAKFKDAGATEAVLRALSTAPFIPPLLATPPK